MSTEYKIAVLLPTRGRTDALKRSVTSIINHAVDSDQIQLLLAFDEDDGVGFEYFISDIQPWLDEKSVRYDAYQFKSLGYAGLNRYYNTLAGKADADWLFVWNDDAVMETPGWDNIVCKYDGEFKILKVHTHNEHPYSIFPIVPKEWYDCLGFLSSHQMIDAEISQLAYQVDRMQIVDIYVVHDQAELTGQTDTTSATKFRFEGNPSDPRDFHHMNNIHRRIALCDKLSAHMQSIGLDTTWWENVKSGKQWPWTQLAKNDINKQMIQVDFTIDEQGFVKEVKTSPNPTIE